MLNKQSIQSSDQGVRILSTGYVQFGKRIAMPVALGVVLTSPNSYTPIQNYIHSTPTQYHDDFFNEYVQLLNPGGSANIRSEKQTPNIFENVTPAPIWLVQRMESLQQMPSPTLQEVEAQFRAVEGMRSKYERSPSNSADGPNNPVT